jgi:hypothetical protein
MADYGVAVTWGDVKPGREKQSLAVWADAVALNDKAVANGRLERWDAVLFEPMGAPPLGAIRLFGSQAQIDEFIHSEDFQSVILRAGLTINAVALRRFTTGDALNESFARFATVVDTL